MPDYRLAQRPGSPRWYIVWSHGRRSKRASTGTEDRRQAELVLAAFRLEKAKRSSGTATIDGILQDYLDGHASALASAVQARIAVKHLTGHFGSAEPHAATAGAWASYIEKRRKAGVTDSTISREMSVARAALRRAELLGMLDAAPHVPELPKAPPRERWLTRGEAARLLWQAHRMKRPAYLTLFLRLALYTGARPGAVLDLTWDRIDLEHRLVNFALPSRQTNKRRTVAPMSGPLYTALRRASRRAHAGPVFQWGGDQVKSVKVAMRRACARAGLQGVTPGTLRHTAATWAVLEGVDIYAVGRLLGHSKPQTTARYAKYAPDYLRDVTDRIARGARQSARQLKERQKTGS